MERKEKQLILRATKIALGSSFAIFLAHTLRLDHEISAGTITLLTIVSTKWETVKLCAYRLLTMLFTIGMTWLFFLHIRNEWIAYGAFIFLLVIVSERLGWGATISVNAVIAAHFLSGLDFSLHTVRNEILLVLIGIGVAVAANLFHDNGNQKKELIRHMRYVEEQMRRILEKMADYLSDPGKKGEAWKELADLEGKIRQYVLDACAYQNNTFASHPGYYIDYFEMRLQQCSVLHNLHDVLHKIRRMPLQAKIVADYIRYMKNYVRETQIPTEQIARLKELIETMGNMQPPQTREDFESRAILYHILMDLEEFLHYKRRFAKGLDERQKKRYWKETPQKRAGQQ